MRRHLCLGRQQHALRDTEAVLLVDHGQPQPTVADCLLKNGVRADQNVDAAVGKAHQRRFAHPPLVAPRQHRDPHIDPRKHPRQGIVMLARQNFGRREHCRLRACLHRDQHGVESDKRLS